MAAKKELTDSQKILTQEQENLLSLISDEKYLAEKFYFTGGTPLAVFYLHHRISEDIDLFSEEEIYLPSINVFIKQAQTKLKAGSVDYKNFLGLHSFQLIFSATQSLKIDFNYYPFPRIERGMRYKNIEVDSPYDIAVNKVHTIVMKPRARDFIDIYYLVKENNYKFYDLLMQAKAKFDWHIDPIQLGSRLLDASGTADYPRMLKPIDHNEWKQFFVEEARKLKDEIFE